MVTIAGQPIRRIPAILKAGKKIYKLTRNGKTRYFWGESIRQVGKTFNGWDITECLIQLGRKELK